MPDLDFSTSIVNIYGPGTTGKSNFMRYLLSKAAYRRHAIFDPMEEYDPEKYTVYRPSSVEYEGGNEELNRFLKACIEGPREKRPRYIHIEEAANFLPGGGKTMGSAASQLAFHNTHIFPGISLITSNRHPTDLNSSIREMYDHMLVFGYRGTNAKKALNGLAEGLTDKVDTLNEYEFIHVDPQGNFSKFAPVDDMGEYNKI